MKFGTQRKNEVEVPRGSFLRNFPSGELKVRFLEEPEEWFSYREHYTPEGWSFPCTRTDKCPGCSSDVERMRKSSRKYATNVFVVKENRVTPFKIPVSLSERLQARADRNDGTLLSRDYTILKTGSGLETEYDVDQEERYEVNTAELLKQGQDVETILMEQFVEKWGDPEQYDESRPSSRSRATAPASTPPASTSTDDVPDTLLSKAEREAKAAKTEEEISEDTLRQMSRPEVIEVYRKAGIEPNEDSSTGELVEELIRRFS